MPDDLFKKLPKFGEINFRIAKVHKCPINICSFLTTSFLDFRAITIQDFSGHNQTSYFNKLIALKLVYCWSGPNLIKCLGTYLGQSNSVKLTELGA